MDDVIWVAIIGVIGTLITSIFNLVNTKKEQKKGTLEKIETKVDNLSKKLDANGDGTKTLLADKLKYLCGKAINEGEITYDELRIIENLYNAYHELGGNGFMTDIYNRVKELKVKM